MLEGEVDDILSAEKLVEICGQEDLSKVKHLELKVDTTDQSIAALGELVPHLRELRLTDSLLCSFRDLGTGLKSLRVLWLPHSNVTDLDGISSLESLQELYLAFNDINDVTPLAMHENIQVLDIESNCVKDMSQLDQLGTCPKLGMLSLEGNPIEQSPHYRRFVFHYIPQLQVLDDVERTEEDGKEVCREYMAILRQQLTNEEIASACLSPLTDRPAVKRRATVGHVNPLGEELQMVADAIKYARIETPESRLGSKQRPQSAGLSRSFSSAQLSPTRRSNSSPFGGTISSLPKTETLPREGSSNLTHGTDVVFAGNLARSLRKRRGPAKPVADVPEPAEAPPRPSIAGSGVSAVAQLRLVPCPKTVEKKMSERDSLLSELRAFKLEEAVAELSRNPAKREAMQRPSTARPANRPSLLQSSTATFLRGEGTHRPRKHSGGVPSAVLAGATSSQNESPTKIKRKLVMRPLTASGGGLKTLNTNGFFVKPKLPPDESKRSGTLKVEKEEEDATRIEELG